MHLERHIMHLERDRVFREAQNAFEHSHIMHLEDIYKNKHSEKEKSLVRPMKYRDRHRLHFERQRSYQRVVDKVVALQ